MVGRAFFFLGTKMLPIVAGLTPIFLIANKLSMLNNIWFLTIIYAGIDLPIAIWMIRAFMNDIPKELFEAAALDGAGLARTFWSVIGPVLAPGIAATESHLLHFFPGTNCYLPLRFPAPIRLRPQYIC